MIIENLDNVKRTIKIVFGFTILILGVALLILPGPGLLIIVLGLVLLASEYVWARILLEKTKSKINKIKNLR